ncbi:YihY/virulence factor BrkB family protein [Afifella sp. H1R]|uniref:YihY/virulence factor BrkB family protein n=1 Tax=Afifella sp. H1R TaxID=2908841 RepID=UPI001F29359D|nr:YihY/virulence factor BrkB family protein [Afifella sp. H1R]MCF1505377.1 YihY/virulence factor BrkB family protein [Afifella sp. H1R]
MNNDRPHSQHARDPRGRDARQPTQIPFLGWKDIFWRVSQEIGEDRVSLVAGGVTFYLLLAAFPALGALVSIYGLYNDPANLASQLQSLQAVMPQAGMDILQQELERLVTAKSSSLSFAFLTTLALSLWSANKGVKSLFQALNVAYEEKEKRNFFVLNVVSLAFTLGFLILIILFLSATIVVPAVLAYLGLHQGWLVASIRWPILLLVAAFSIGILYRYGPSRRPSRWRWVTWGGTITAVVWIAASILFSWYIANFADYNATYGSLGAVIGIMMWIWVSVFVLLAGAELNAEMEHQTARDTTLSPEKPIGLRGAHMADTVGKGLDGSGGGAGIDLFGTRQPLGRDRPFSFGELITLGIPFVLIAILLTPPKRRSAKSGRHSSKRDARETSEDGKRSRSEKKAGTSAKDAKSGRRSASGSVLASVLRLAAAQAAKR